MAVNIQRAHKQTTTAKQREVLFDDVYGTPKQTKTTKAKIKQAGEGIDDDDLEMIALGDEGENSLGLRTPRATGDALDFRRRQVMRLLLRGIQKRTIARYLNISAATLYRDIEAINDQVREDVHNIDMPLFVGMTVEFYDEVRNIALRMATNIHEESKSIRLAALKVSLDAETDKHKYLAMTGLYGHVVRENTIYKSVSHTSDDGTEDRTNFKRFITEYYEPKSEPPIV